MGYTRYWTRTNKPITQEFVDGVKEIIKQSAHYGIAIRGAYGNGFPVVTLDEVVFNGEARGQFDLSYEAFSISNDSDEYFCLCKTAKRPYDYTVRKVLALAKKEGLVINVSSDEPNNKIYSDEEYIRGWN